jgi:hypothetical protein
VEATIRLDFFAMISGSIRPKQIHGHGCEELGCAQGGFNQCHHRRSIDAETRILQLTLEQQQCQGLVLKLENCIRCVAVKNNGRKKIKYNLSAREETDTPQET